MLCVFIGLKFHFQFGNKRVGVGELEKELKTSDF